MKKYLMVIVMASIILSIFLITASAAYQSTLPTLSEQTNYQYWAVFDYLTDGTPTNTYLMYSDSSFGISNHNGDLEIIPGTTTLNAISYSLTPWTGSVTSTSFSTTQWTGFKASTINFRDSSFTINNIDENTIYFTTEPQISVEWIDPQDNEEYTMEDLPTISLNVEGATTGDIVIIRNDNEVWRYHCIDLDTSSPYLQPFAVPWAPGEHKIQFQTTGENVVISQVQFTVTGPDVSVLKIVGVENGGTVMQEPVLYLQRRGVFLNNTYRIMLNGEYYCDVPRNQETFRINHKRGTYPAGVNKIDVFLITLTGQTYEHPATWVQFTVLREGIPTIEDVQNDNPEPQKPGEDATITDWIKYYFDVVIYYIKMPFVYLGNAIETLVTSISDTMYATQGIGAILSHFFNWLPGEVMGMIALAVVVIIILRFIGR